MASIKISIVYDRLFKFLNQDTGSVLFFFLLGLTLRGIPELLISWYPVGYETITWYAPPMMTFLGRSVSSVFGEFFLSGPFFYMLMWMVSNVTGAHAFAILKIVGPLLYGVLSVSFFVFLKHGLKFDWKMAFVATLILVFQIAVLRESWDRFRTVLGLIFLFVTLTSLKNKSKHKWLIVSIFAFLTALSRDYVALVLFVTIFGFTIFEKKDRVLSILALGPALAIFLAMVNPSLFGAAWNYMPEGQATSRSYLWVVQDAIIIFAVCYLALLPFVLMGLNRDKLTGSMTSWLLLSSFSIVSPWFAISGYQRWLMLLVFPFTVYATRGFERLHLFEKHRIWMLITVVSVFIILGVGYSSGTFSYVGQATNSYVAVNLLQSSIRWDQVNDVKAALKWLDENAASNSSILAEECFYGWTLIYFERANDDVKVISYEAASSPTPALETALSDGSSQIYLIWYTAQSLNNFEIIHSQNSISVLQYAPRIAQFRF